MSRAAFRFSIKPLTRNASYTFFKISAAIIEIIHCITSMKHRTLWIDNRIASMIYMHRSRVKKYNKVIKYSIKHIGKYERYFFTYPFPKSRTKINIKKQNKKEVYRCSSFPNIDDCHLVESSVIFPDFRTPFTGNPCNLRISGLLIVHSLLLLLQPIPQKKLKTYLSWTK